MSIKRTPNLFMVPFMVISWPVVMPWKIVPWKVFSCKAGFPDFSNKAIVVEFFLKLVFAPAYGQLLLKRPLTIFSLFNDSEDVIGLSARFTKDKQSLKVIFENDQIAREFEMLNPIS